MYNFIICDISGVIHNGKKLLNGALDFLKYCQLNNIFVLLFSNAPRKSSIIQKNLSEKFGLERGLHYNDILTSGDYFINKAQTVIKPNSKCFFFGEDKDLYIIKEINAVQTEVIDEAEFILICGKFYDQRDDKVDELFDKLKKRNILAYCLNPDLTAQINGVETYCTGTIGKKYEDFGGKVQWCGKPYIEIYNFILEKFKFDKNKTIAIGDSIRTDIVGSKNFGIENVLVTTGIKNIESVAIPNLTIKNLTELIDHLKAFL